MDLFPVRLKALPPFPLLTKLLPSFFLFFFFFTADFFLSRLSCRRPTARFLGLFLGGFLGFLTPLFMEKRVGFLAPFPTFLILFCR